MPPPQALPPLHRYFSRNRIQSDDGTGTSTATWFTPDAPENRGKSHSFDVLVEHWLAYSGKGRVKRKSDYHVHHKGDKYTFSRWTKGELQCLTGEKARKKWKVGIAVNPFRFLQYVPGRYSIFSRLSSALAHWGVYTWEENPQKTGLRYRVYSINFNMDRRYLFLEQVWGTRDGWHARPAEIQKLPGSEITMYFAKEEFALYAEMFLQVFIRKSPLFQNVPLNEEIQTSGEAYRLLAHNCQHFCKGFLAFLKEKGFQDPSRHEERFFYDHLSDMFNDIEKEMKGPGDNQNRGLISKRDLVIAGDIAIPVNEDTAATGEEEEQMVNEQDLIMLMSIWSDFSATQELSLSAQPTSNSASPTPPQHYFDTLPSLTPLSDLEEFKGLFDYQSPVHTDPSSRTNSNSLRATIPDPP